jgi:sulfur-oxidizing protein SoxX
MRSARLWTVLAFAATLVGCATARDPAKGFRLAGNGDAHRGKAAFQEFGCTRCHEVQGATLPRPTVQRVVLGGSVMAEPSDGYLVTAIFNPVFHATAYPLGKNVPAPNPRMPEYADRMTVQQLTDIVVYLKTRYTLRPAAVPNEFP